jgi:hypothetical protein
VVGDRQSTCSLARVGAPALVGGTGSGATEEARPQDGVAADAVVDNLAAAASWFFQSGSLKSSIRICN